MTTEQGKATEKFKKLEFIQQCTFQKCCILSFLTVHSAIRVCYEHDNSQVYFSYTYLIKRYNYVL
jgi:hypothetical protein